MIDRRTLILGAAAGVVAHAAAAAEDRPRIGGRTRVLSVANGYTKGTWPGKLDKTLADSEAFLAEAAKLPRSVITPLHSENFDTFRAGISSFLGDCKSADTIAFHYSGHGVQGSNQNFLITQDGSTLVSIQSLLLSLRGSLIPMPDGTKRGRTVVAFLNACRDNPMASRANGSAGLSLYEDIFDEPRSFDENHGLDGLREFNLSEDDQAGMSILFSTALGKTARESVEDPNDPDAGPDDELTPFGRALVRHLRDKVNVPTLFARIAARVDLATSGTIGGFRQTPHWQGANLEEIWLAGYPRMRPLPL